MNTKHVVLHSIPNDPFVAAVRGNEAFQLVHIDELQTSIQLSAWPKVLATSFPESILRRFDGAVLHNRIFSIEATRLGQELRDQRYQHSWAHIALQPVYRRTAETVHDVGVRGVTRGLLPLNTQWWAIQNFGVFPTPKYVYAFGQTEPNISHLRDPFRKSIWSVHDWKEERHFALGEDHWHAFYVERPVGIPVVCNFVGDDIGFVFLKSKCAPPIDDYRRLAAAASAAFRSSIGEVLTFLEDDGVVRFYAFSPLLAASSKDPEFIARIANYFPGESLAREPNGLPYVSFG